MKLQYLGVEIFKISGASDPLTPHNDPHRPDYTRFEENRLATLPLAQLLNQPHYGHFKVEYSLETKPV